MKPVRKSVRRVIEQPGTVQAFEETPLYAKFPGYVRTVKADIGDRVKGPREASTGAEIEPGQILAEIAIPELEEEAAQKEAVVRQSAVAVEQAAKSLLTADASIAAAEATVLEAKAGQSRAQANVDRWQSESRRVTGLVASRVIDEQTRDETLNQFRSAEAARAEVQARVGSAEAMVRKAKAERAKAEADVRGADAHLKVTEADARRLQAMLQYTKIRAPFDGVVTRRRVDTGHFLQPPGGGRGEPLFTVARLDPVRVFVDVPEADAALVGDGAEVRIAVQSLKGPELTGTVTRTAWALEPGSRTLRTEIDLPNPQGRLRPGMYAYARITVALPESWVLPATALVKQADVTVCFRVENGKALRTPVQVGRGDGEFTEVLKWQSPSPAGTWKEFTGGEAVLGNHVTNVVDGQALPTAEPAASR